MNKINKSNYEEFMIDYLDGTLSAEREAELLLFLEANPSIKSELDGLDEMVLSEVNEVFECRDCLKKSVLDSSLVNEDNFETFCIASLENDLNELEAEHLKNYLHNYPSRRAIYNQYAQLKLQPLDSHGILNKNTFYHLATQSNERINRDNYVDFIIARNEGDLSALQNRNLDLFIKQNPALHKEIEAFAKLKLQADTSLIYEKKSALKRRKIAFIWSNGWANTAAASVAIFLFFYFIIPSNRWNNVKSIEPIQSVNTAVYQKDTTTDTSKLKKSIPVVETKLKHKPKEVISYKKKKQTKKTPRTEIRETVAISTVEYKSCKDLGISMAKIQPPTQTPFGELANSINKQKDPIKEEGIERTIEIKGVAGKLLSKLGKSFKNDKRKKANFKEQLIAVADYAVEGFNRMTEADISIPSRRDKPSE